MSTQNLALVVGSYDDTASAADDYQALRSGQDAGGYEIIGAVVLVRDKDGKVQVREHGDKSVFGVDVDEYLAPGTSAVVAVVDDKWADNVEKALTRADKRISKAIDSDDYEKLRKAIEESADDVVEQINS
ncbi:MAG: hypothetical protein K0Q52_3385 [Microbacterium sp.]|nr:hypothetical protein [Microbacterium sp.]